MDWFFDRKGKSIANSAQRVVKDMHKELELQTNKIKELEKTIFKFKNMCTASLERDITRLENRKQELILELEQTDDAIVAAQERLKLAKEAVSNVLMPYNKTNTISTIHNHRKTSLEEEYLEEIDLSIHIKSLTGEMLFFIHFNINEEILIFVPSYSDPSQIVTVSKITDVNDPKSVSALSVYEQIIVSHAILH